MYMKKVMNWWLMAAVVLGVSFGFTACSDDDDDNNGSTEQRSDVDPLDNEEAQTAFRWLCALTSAQTLDENWKSKTYEPTVGVASENDNYTRIIVVNDLAEAKQDFACLAAKDPSTLSGKLVVSGGAAGTMTWEPSKEGAQNLAVVTVSSRILPHLQKIVYCTEDQVGLNGSLFGNDMKGTAYYRFGDVIQDGEGYYWVCVRPCFAPNSKECSSKGDSHWINIFNAAQSGDKKGLPDANMITKWDNQAKYGNQTIILPTKLPYKREHIYNLSRLVWALIDPAAYDKANEGISTAALGGFPYTYHSSKFLKDVAKFWNEKGEDNYTIWEKLFNHTYEEMQHLINMHFIYQGYSWKWGESGYVYRYSTDGYEKAYFGEEYNDEYKVNYVQEGFNIKYFAQANVEEKAQKPYNRFTNSSSPAQAHSGTWVVRYKKGEDLMTSGKFNYWGPITSKDGKTKDVYVYNKRKGIQWGENCPAETQETFKIVDAKPLDAPALCSIIGADGKFYKNVEEAKAANNNKDAVAVVVALNGKKRVELGQDFNGLAMALTSYQKLPWREDTEESDCGVKGSEFFKDFIPTRNGMALTTQYVNGCGKNHKHTAAQYCRNYTSTLTAEVRAQKGFSEWFMPSGGQCVIAAKALGERWSDTEGFSYMSHQDEVQAVIKKMNDAGFTGFNANLVFWTTTIYDNKTPCVFFFRYTHSLGQPTCFPYSESYWTVPFIAFKYDGGATMD